MSKLSAMSAKGASKVGATASLKKATKKKASKKTPKKVAKEPVSLLAPKKLASLPPLAGVELATTNSGTKYKGRDDLLVARMAEGTQVVVCLQPPRQRLLLLRGAKIRLKTGSLALLLSMRGTQTRLPGKQGCRRFGRRRQ